VGKQGCPLNGVLHLNRSV